jgi:DNA-directed RNA polymerase I subunit RPA49
MFRRPRTTPQLELLLLAHLFALCLRIDNYAADHALIARDLSLAPEKYVPSVIYGHT